MLSNFTKASYNFRSLRSMSRSLTRKNLKPKGKFARNFDKKGMLNNVKELTIQDENNKILAPPKLPGPPILTSTITRNEAKIHLVGVGHYTKKSQEHVANVIRQTQPNVVFVELCENRRRHLTNPKIAVNEMHTAFKEAQKIPGCQLHLGDRHLWITLMRVLTYSSLSKSISFIYEFFTTTWLWFFISKYTKLVQQKEERCLKELQQAERLLEKVEKKKQYIESIHEDIYCKVICEERDTYMAYELQKVTKNCMEDAVDGSPKPPVVVAVVGLAHVGGILEKIDKVTDQDVAEITQVSPLYASMAMMKIGFYIIGIGAKPIFIFAFPFIFIFQFFFGNL